MCSSLDYQTGDDGLLDTCRVVVRNVDQVTLLSPASELDSYCRSLLNWTVLPPPLLHSLSSRLYLTTNVCFLCDATCATSSDTASATTHRPILVVKSGVPDAPPDHDFDKYFASSGFSGVHQLEQVDVFVSDTDDMFSALSTISTLA